MLITLNQAELPVRLKFPSTVGTKWGGVFKQNWVPFNYTGWTASATLQHADDTPVSLTVDTDSTTGDFFMTVAKATALLYAGKTVNFVMQVESGGLGYVPAYGTIFFDKHPTT